ncbi:MAG: DnaA N-terminal domain-containing protein [Chloroflexota bacterium]
MTSADLLALIADDTKQISYRPRWNSFTGSITATILLQQVIYRWVHNGRKPFYKFNEPCSHPAYRPGDSWCEELGFSRRELETARGRIAAHTQGDLSLKTFVSYWRDADRKTWYALNEMAVLMELEALYPAKDTTGAGIQGRLVLPEGEPDLMADSAISNEPDSDLMADSAISNDAPTPPSMAESANSRAETGSKPGENGTATRESALMAESAISNEPEADLMADSAISTDEKPTLMADSAISNDEKPALMAESANSQWRKAPIANGGKRHYQMADSAICLNTKITTKKTTKKTTKTTTTPACETQGEPPGLDVVVAVLAWLGFVGNCGKEPLTAETALAWAFWLQLHRPRLTQQGKDPLAITIAAWRRGQTQPPADCQRLAKAWLNMNDQERRLTLTAAAQPLLELQAAMPQELWPFDIPTSLLAQLDRLTHGQFLPPALLPPEEPETAQEPETAVSRPKPAPAPTEPPYQMPPETAVLWKNVLDELKLQMTQATFNTWLKDSKLKLNGGQTAEVLVRNSYAADWINGRLQETVSRTLSAVAGRQLHVQASEDADG